MRNLLYVLSALAVVALGFWAYRENYRTQAELDAVRDLRGDIGALRESLSMLRAEWAYLNRPDRLRELADINFDRLQLLPLVPDQFGSIEEIAYPMPETTLPFGDGLADAIDTTSATAEGQP